MIPFLYRGDETVFKSGGFGRLTDIQECTVTEERNGLYEVEFTYPVNARFYKQMVSMVEAYSAGNYEASGIIACIHDDHHDIQPFDIYSVSTPIDGVATFNAHHISYRLSGLVVAPFEAGSCVAAFEQINNHLVGAQSSLFSFSTDKVTRADFKLEVPKNARSILGGEEGSILDVFGTGEYVFDKFNVKLMQNRGTYSGVTIRYGKNLMDVKREIDSSGHYNAICPYWEGDVTDEGSSETKHVVVTLTPQTSRFFYVLADDFNRTRNAPVIAVADFSQDFEDPPTQNQLRERALLYLSRNKPWLPDNNIKVNFVQLWQTTEYENVAILQRLSLCDYVSIYYEELGIVAEEQEVIKVVYNVILERYDEVEIGKTLSSFADTVSDSARIEFSNDLEKAKSAAISYSAVQAAINHATELITGGLGGHVIMHLNADGEPQEILVMDTDDPATAMNVIRINKNGIGFSQKGYNGPFLTAWTIDGAFNADFITAGRINGALIKTGYITDASGKSRWDLTSGDFYSRTITLEHEGYGDELPKTGKVITKLGRFKIAGSGTVWGSNWENTYGVGLEIYGDGNKVSTYASGGATSYADNDEYLMIFPANEGGHISAMLDNQGNEFQYKRSGIIASSALSIISGGRIRNAVGGGYGYVDIESRSGVAIGQEKDYIVGAMHVYNTSVEIGQSYSGPYSAATIIGTDRMGGILTFGSIKAYGNKNRVVKTSDYSDRLQYAYETAEPYFGDIGEGILDEEGICIVSIDDIFSETVDTSSNYQVFLQKYGEGDLWVDDRKPTYFIVKGTANLKFGWEIKAKQFDHSCIRLEENTIDTDSNKSWEEEYNKPLNSLDSISDFIDEQEAAFDETT